MGDVSKWIIEPMISLYGEAKSDNADALLDVYERILGGFANEVLRRSFDDVAGTYRPSFAHPWPLPAHFLKAAEKHASVLQPKSAVHLPGVKREPASWQDQDRAEKAAAWRAEATAEYGSVDAFLTKTRTRRKGFFET